MSYSSCSSFADFDIQDFSHRRSSGLPSALLRRYRPLVDVTGLRRRRLDDRGLGTFFARFDVQAHFHAVYLLEDGITHRILVKVYLSPILERNEAVAFLEKELRHNPPLGRRIDIHLMRGPLFADFFQLEPQGFERQTDGFLERLSVLSGRDRMPGDLHDEEHAVGIGRFAVVVLCERDADMRDLMIPM